MGLSILETSILGSRTRRNKPKKQATVGRPGGKGCFQSPDCLDRARGCRVPIVICGLPVSLEATQLPRHNFEEAQAPLKRTKEADAMARGTAGYPRVREETDQTGHWSGLRRAMQHSNNTVYITNNTAHH